MIGEKCVDLLRRKAAHTFLQVGLGVWLGQGGGGADVAVELQTEPPDVEVIDVRRGRFPTPLT